MQGMFNSIPDAVDLCNRGWSPLCKIVVLSSIINCFNTIWYCRNQRRFEDRKINFKTAINFIISTTSMTGNCAKLAARSNIHDFVLLKAFSVRLRLGNAPKIKEVLWQPPILNWVKCNIDGASRGNPGPSSCGGIFRDSTAAFLGAFSFNLGVGNPLTAELNGAMIAIEMASQKGWNHLWIETDSMLVTLAFKSKIIVPWNLRNRWDNCLHLISSMSFIVSHVYREGNYCVDKLAGIGLDLNTHFWWDHLPSQIRDDFTRNRMGLPYFRFCS